MRILALICLSLLFGFVLGRWGPTDDLRRVRMEMKELKSGASGAGRARESVAVTVREFLQIDETDTGLVEAEDEAGRAGDEPPPPGQSEPSAQTKETVGTATGEQVTPPAIEEQLEMAKMLWQTRSDLARNSFLQNTGAMEGDAVRFDVLIQGMNIRLKSRIDEWVARIEQEEEIRAEDGARLIHQLSGDVVLTYDEFDRSFRDTWREDAGADFKLFDFIDPSVAESLAGIEDKLEAFEP